MERATRTMATRTKSEQRWCQGLCSQPSNMNSLATWTRLWAMERATKARLRANVRTFGPPWLRSTMIRKTPPWWHQKPHHLPPLTSPHHNCLRSQLALVQLLMTFQRRNSTTSTHGFHCVRGQPALVRSRKRALLEPCTLCLNRLSAKHQASWDSCDRIDICKKWNYSSLLCLGIMVSAGTLRYCNLASLDLASRGYATTKTNNLRYKCKLK